MRSISIISSPGEGVMLGAEVAFCGAGAGVGAGAEGVASTFDDAAATRPPSR